MDGERVSNERSEGDRVSEIEDDLLNQASISVEYFQRGVQQTQDDLKWNKK